MKKMYYSRISFIFLLVCSIYFLFKIYEDSIVSFSIKLGMIIGVIVLLIIMLKLCNSKKFSTRFIGGILSIAIGFTQVIGLYHIAGVYTFLSKISLKNDEINMLVYVRARDNIELKDLKGKKIGIKPDNNIGFYHSANFNVEGIFETEQDYGVLFKSLEKEDIDAVMIPYIDQFKIKEFYPEFDVKMKLLAKITSEDIYAHLKASNINEETYTVYVSGIDQYGEIREYGLSDVNILLTVNPKTNKVLMTTVPRDTLVNNECTTTTLPDKLTHVGNDGVSCSIKTLSNLLNVKINYFIKINFTSVMDIVDALGGIDVVSEYSFNSYDMDEEENHFEFNKGINHLNGRQALVFSRTRNAFEDGDVQRGKNQQAVLKGIIDKIKTPAVLLNYDKVLTAISNNINTSFSVDELKLLLKRQLEVNPDWIIESQTISGESVSALTESYPDIYLSAFEADSKSLNEAIKKIHSNLK